MPLLADLVDFGPAPGPAVPDSILPHSTVPSYSGRLFGPPDATPGCVVGHYHQHGDLVWADFAGGPVRTGRLVGVRDQAGVLQAAYCQVMADGEVVAGRCRSVPTVLDDGRLRLTEHWRRADGSSGVSVIQELPHEFPLPPGRTTGPLAGGTGEGVPR